MLEEKILNTIKEYDLIEDGNNIVIGVSGGPDSMALLNALISLIEKKKINCKLFVAHVNHGIRKEAEFETKYVEEFCKKKNIDCYVKKEKVEEIAKNNKVGTEEAGRKLRYDFFDEVLQKVNASKIATAHNLNDNAETVLMNIIRGSGTSGLKGIEVKRDNKYIRPLIKCNRDEIEKYCEDNDLKPKIDKTNMENIYTRNKIRNMLLPYIKENFNPNISESLNRLSELAYIENEYIENQVKKIYMDVKIEENNNEIVLDLKQFNKQDKVIKNRLVLYTINELLGTHQNIEKIHIRDIIKLCDNNIGNKYLIPNKKVKILVNKGKIFFKKNI